MIQIHKLISSSQNLGKLVKFENKLGIMKDILPIISNIVIKTDQEITNLNNILKSTMLLKVSIQRNLEDLSFARTEYKEE